MKIVARDVAFVIYKAKYSDRSKQKQSRAVLSLQNSVDISLYRHSPGCTDDVRGMHRHARHRLGSSAFPVPRSLTSYQQSILDTRQAAPIDSFDTRLDSIAFIVINILYTSW